MAGVDLLEQLTDRGWLEAQSQPNPDRRTFYNLTPQGKHALEKLGVGVSRAADQRKPFSYGCLDWTERRHHLRGSLAIEIMLALSDRGVALRNSGSRTVALESPIEEWLQKGAGKS